MYSFPGANHNLHRKRVRERTKLYNISTIVMVFSLCLAQQAQAGEEKPPNVTFDKDCTSEWFTLRVGYTKTLQVASWIRDVGNWGWQCHYRVQAEGAFLSNDQVLGKDTSKYVCELDWLDVCSCRTE